MPSPIMSLSRMAQASPVPAQTIFVIGGRDGERADGLRGLVVEDRRPAHAAVGGLPDAARRRADVVGAGIAGDAGSGGDAVADRRSHEAEAEIFGQRCVLAAALSQQRDGTQ